MSVRAVDRPDRTAHDAHEIASRAEHAADMFNLALLCAATDLSAARRWYRRAAVAGHAAAMINLGVLIAGEDPAGARTWFARAAAIGLPEARENLAALDARRCGPQGAGPVSRGRDARPNPGR